jgi:hypothetical protein
MIDKNKVDTIFDIPNQNVSYNDKIKNDYAMVKQSINSYIQRSTFTTNTWKLKLKKLYDYYNGNVYEEDYKLITEPFGTKIEGTLSDVQNYPIINTKIDLLCSEYAKRPKKDMVYVINDDVVTEKTEALNEQINMSLEQEFINTLNQRGVPTNVDSEPVDPPDRIKQEFESTYRDKRAINGQKSINYIKAYNRLDEVFDLNFFHWLVSGETYTYKGVEHNEPVEETVNSLDIDFDKDPDVQFVEDGDWVVRRKYMHPSTIIDMFYDELTPEEIKLVDTLAIQGPALNSNSNIYYDRSVGYKQWSRLIEVMHVVWKSRKKIGIVSFMDELGAMQSLEVDELYKPTLDQTIEWYWVNEVWEGYKIGTSMYKRMRPVPYQRGSIDNPSKCKLPYNGRIMSNINSRSVSLVSRGIPYQVLYNSTFHRLKLAMAKMKDDMAMVDVNWRPAGWSMEKWLLYADQVSMLFVDYSKDTVKMNSTHQTRLQLASQTINLYTELLAFIKSEWDEVCGISKQREGQISSQETVGGVERSVLQSSLITEMYFTKFDQFRQRELEGLIDVSKLAWINGKKGSFVMPGSSEVIYMDIDALDHCETEYGIAVSTGNKEQERLQIVQQLAQPMMQNGVAASGIVDILDADTISEAKTRLRIAEKKMQEYEQAAAQAEQQSAQQLEMIRQEALQVSHEFTLEQIDRKGMWDLKKAELTALGIDEGDDGPDIIENAKLAFEQIKLSSELADKANERAANQYNDDKRMQHERDLKDKDLKIKEKELASKEKIARSKPKTATKK